MKLIYAMFILMLSTATIAYGNNDDNEQDSEQTSEFCDSDCPPETNLL